MTLYPTVNFDLSMTDAAFSDICFTYGTTQKFFKLSGLLLSGNSPSLPGTC